MTKTFSETLLFASVAINSALLLFFSGVHRQMMDAVNGATYKDLTALLVQYSSRSPFMIITLNLPLIGAIPYYYCYGFGHWWITLGLGIWLAAGSLAKLFKLPVYKAIAAVNIDDATHLQELRQKLSVGNIFQAVFYAVAVVEMAIGLYNNQ